MFRGDGRPGGAVESRSDAVCPRGSGRFRRWVEAGLEVSSVDLVGSGRVGSQVVMLRAVGSGRSPAGALTSGSGFRR